MANRRVEGAKGTKEYQFQKLPENIRQMGEQPERNRVYIEDYVVTYMNQVFQKRQEEAIVVFVGKRGEAGAKDNSFIYGAMEIELDLLSGTQEITQEKWDKIYETICENFPGAQVLGWGCGVSMWNSQIDKNVKKIQQKHFSQEEKILFLEDLGEKEERIFHWYNGRLEELPGYVIYYEKNPLMQEFMLKGQQKKSFEAEYQDEVMTNVREVIHRKEEKEENRKFATYAVGFAMLLLTVLGANLLLQSSKKIDSLEKTLETLSNATVNETALPEKQKASQTEQQSTFQPTQSPAQTNDAATATAFDPVAKEQPKETVPPVAKKEEKPAATQKPKATEKPSVSAKKTEKNNKKKTKATGNPKEASALWGTTQSYVVRSGDTLSQIVWRQYHTMKYMDMVKKANNIENENDIKAGQRIVLPKYQK